MIVTVMFMGVLSMIAMGLTLKNYNAALDKQQHVSDYYAADAVAELIRIGKEQVEPSDAVVDIQGAQVQYKDEAYIITYGTVTITTKIDTASKEFNSWEVSYHAAQPAE